MEQSTDFIRANKFPALLSVMVLLGSLVSCNWYLGL